MTSRAPVLLLSGAVLTAACGLLEPEQRGDPNAQVIIYGAVAEPGGAPAPAVPVYGRGLRGDDCTRLVTAELSVTTDVAGRYRMVLHALSTAFRGCVEISLDPAEALPWQRLRGVPFREGDALDSFRVDLVRDSGG